MDLSILSFLANVRIQRQRERGVARPADQLRSGHSPGDLHPAWGKQEVTCDNTERGLSLVCREMAVMKGDYLEVLNTDRKWWKVRNKSQEVRAETYETLSLCHLRSGSFPSLSCGC